MAIRRLSGFTILETLVVILIAAILMTIVTIAAKQAGEIRRNSQSKAVVSTMNSALEDWKYSTGEYPRIAGDFSVNPGDMSISNNHKEIMWQTLIIDGFMESVTTRYMMERISSNIEVIDQDISEPIKRFRTADKTGKALNDVESSVSSFVINFAREQTQHKKLKFVKDGFGNYLNYIPSDAYNPELSTKALGRFVSVGKDGILQSMPFRHDYNGSWQQYAGSVVVDVRNNRHFGCVNTHVSNPYSIIDTNWKEVDSDDIY